MFSSVKNRLDLQETVGQIQIWNNPIETSTAADLDLLTIQATLTSGLGRSKNISDYIRSNG